MADNNFSEAAVAGRDVGESSDEIIEVKIKTLDSQIYPFRVNRRMPVPALKEKVATVIGVPSEQQRLICRGKVLKDDQLLSDYHVEDGHTLHLVVRQPVHAPPSNTAGSSGSDGTPEQQGADPTAGGSRNRIGQVSHGVVLGTFNVPDQGDGGIPDLNRIITAVLNSVGIGNLAPVNAGTGSGATMMASVLPNQGQQGSGLEGQGRQDNVSARSQAVNQLQTGQVVPDFQFEPVHRAFHTPSTLQPRPFPQAMVIQDALTTLSQYLDRMEQAFPVNGFNNQPQSFTSRNTEGQDQGNASGLSTASRGLPTPAALGAVIRHTQEFLNGQAGAALSQFAEQLEGEVTVTDSTVRSQIQSAAMRNGIMMQHLGALLLELGRTTLTLRLGQSHADSVVNAGPAVYISPSGPNPIMVQPPPFQPSTSFGAFPIAAVQPNAGVTVGPVGPGDVPRNISIHIHAGGTSVIPGSTSEQENHASRQQGTGQANQVGNGTASRETIDGLAVPIRTVGAAVPARPPTEATSASFGLVYPLLARFQPQGVPVRSLAVSFVNGGQSGSRDTAQQSLDSIPLPTTLAQVHAQMRNVNVAMQTVNSSSASVATSASESALPVQEVPQNQAEQDLAQQGQSAEHLSSIDIDGRNRLRNDDQGNVSIAGSSEMANLVNSVFQQVIEAYSRSGRADQQSHQQQQAVSPGSVNESTTEEQSNLNDKTVGNKRANSLENTTVDAGPSVSSVDVDGQERDMVLPSSNTIPTRSCASSERGSSDGEATVPVGLGLGGLQPLRRHSSKQNRKQQTNKQTGSGAEGGNSAALPSGGQDGQSSVASGQNVLQALASQWSSNDNRTDENGLSAQLPNGLAQMFSSMGSGGQAGGRGVDVGGIISQLLRSPAVNSLLQGMSEQTGTVPPVALSNMVQQVMQSPLLINTMQNVTEQLAERSQGLEDMLSGFGGRQGGIDFSRVLQQVMPIVSQAIGRESQVPVADLGSQTQLRTLNEEQRSSVEDKEAVGPNLQIDLEPTIQQLTHHDPPEDVLRTMVENAMVLYAANDGTPNGVDTAEFSRQLSDTEGLANEYLDMLNRDFITRLQTDSESVDDS